MRRMSVSVAGMLQAGKEPVVEASIRQDNIARLGAANCRTGFAISRRSSIRCKQPTTTLENQLSFAIKNRAQADHSGGTTKC